jgi:hypothetical protein
MKILFLVVLTLLVVGCEPTAQEKSLNLHRIGGVQSSDIYTLTIDGHKYILVIYLHGVAFCPATTN